MEVVFGDAARSVNIAVTENGNASREAFVADLLMPGGLTYGQPEVVPAASDLSPERVEAFIKNVHGLKVVPRTLAS